MPTVQELDQQIAELQRQKEAQLEKEKDAAMDKVKNSKAGKPYAQLNTFKPEKKEKAPEIDGSGVPF